MTWNKLPQRQIAFNTVNVPTLLPPVDNCFSIYDFFNYFFNNCVVDIIVNNTNKRLKPDEYTTRKEVKAFIGLLGLPDFRRYKEK